MKDSSYENGRLTRCHVPYVPNATVTKLSFRIQEYAFDGKVSYSNYLQLALQLVPILDSLQPQVLPAWDPSTFTVKVRGQHFVAGRTVAYFGDFHVSPVTVVNSTFGSITVPANVTPGVVAVGISNDHRMPEASKRVRVLEFIKLPEVLSLIP